LQQQNSARLWCHLRWLSNERVSLLNSHTQFTYSILMLVLLQHNAQGYNGTCFFPTHLTHLTCHSPSYHPPLSLSLSSSPLRAQQPQRLVGTTRSRVTRALLSLSWVASDARALPLETVLHTLSLSDSCRAEATTLAQHRLIIMRSSHDRQTIVMRSSKNRQTIDVLDRDMIITIIWRC
jgi:hypothetical protein